jgi:hypothetical protein
MENTPQSPVTPEATETPGSPDAQPPQLPEPSQPPPAEETPPTPAPPPSKKHKVLKIVLIVLGIIFVLILLCVSAAAYYLQKNGITMDRISPKAVPTSTVTNTTNSPNNTYHNNAYKFSMPYPKELKINEKPYGFGVSSVEMRAPATPSDYGPDFQMLVFPKAIGAQIGQDFDKYYSLADNTTQEIKDAGGTTVKFTKIKNRTVNNLRAFDFTSGSVPADPDEEAEIGVYIEMGTDTLVISTPESNKAKLDTMLADFKYPLQ